MTALNDLARGICSRPPPQLVGVAGAVAVGKTTIAGELAAAIASFGRTVRTVGTDAFLCANAVLSERNLLMRKGFPESYDTDALVAALRTLKGGEPVTVPVYSHRTYDIADGSGEEIEPADVVIVEGVNALQEPIVAELDIAVYVDAPEETVRGWFVDRFHRLTDEAREDATSFYNGFAQLEPGSLRSVAEGTWDGINGVNLREHIGPSRDSAHVIISKADGHEIVEVRRVR
jgi:type I pantothenate kinase